MHERATAEIIQFPKPSSTVSAEAAQRDAGRERLLAALASLEDALAVQRAAVAEWRGSLRELRGAVSDLGGSLQRYRERLGTLGERVAVLNGQARQLEELTETMPPTPAG